MLGIQKVRSLADIVGFSEGDLRLTAEFVERDVSELVAYEVGKSPRSVICVRGSLRKFQERFYDRRLKCRLSPSKSSFGSVPGRDIVDNASIHLGQRYIYKTDISNCYPSMTTNRVSRLFLKQLRCSPEVSRFLTRLCTYKFHLSLGLLTSPILADQILLQVDRRIECMCRQYDARYSRYVDDIAISAQFNIQESPIPECIRAIFKSCGLRQNMSKTMCGRLDGADRTTITGLRLKDGVLDVSLDYVRELERQIADHASLARGGPFDGPLFGASQLLGRVNYVSWVNRNRETGLKRRLKAIDWDALWAEARSRGIVQARKRVLPRTAPAPDFSACFGRN